MDREKLTAAISLLRRLPPSKIDRNAQAVASLIPDLAEDLLSKVDKPLEIGVDPDTGHQYIQSEFNRDGDSFRSHYSNKYDPPIQDAIFPSQHARELEIAANQLFIEYELFSIVDDQKPYFFCQFCGITSTYFWDKEDGQLACAVLVKKDVDHKQQIESGTWDSINVIDIKVDNSKQKINYSITSTVVLEMAIKNNQGGDINISGSLTKAKEMSYQFQGGDIDAFHLEKIGKLVEEMESLLRTSLDTIYVGKTKEVVYQIQKQQYFKSIFTIRSIDGSFEMEKNKQGLAGMIVGQK